MTIQNNIPQNFEKINTEELAEKCGGQIKKTSKPNPEQFAHIPLADKFAQTYATQLRYVPAFGRWFTWTGTHWTEDTTLTVRNHAVEVCKQTAKNATDTKEGNSKRFNVQSRSTVRAVEELARCHPTLVATVEQWDTDKYLLPTPSGTVDLRTGETKEADPLDYLTGCTSVGPAHTGIKPELWLQFLDRITAGDQELQAYLQRVAGYCLSGLTHEHVFFFGYGTGRNGKGVFLHTLKDILGNTYARNAAETTFTAAKHDAHKTEIAMLRGARLVTLTETQQGRRWNESRIKAATGGDPLTANFMRHDLFEFIPDFKLFVTGNHKPSLAAVDEAMKSRLKIIPFTVTIPEEERDPDLPNKLKDEYPAILRWMIDGFLSYQEQGLNEPACVKDASTDYFESEDLIGNWIEERTINGKEEEKSSALFNDYKYYCEQLNEKPGSNKLFSQMLEARGYKKKKTREGAYFGGIRLLLNKNDKRKNDIQNTI